MDPRPSAEAVAQLWTWSIAIYFVVVAVVAFLLWQILLAARAVRTAVSDIWTVGQKVANNTIHIPLLQRTNFVAAQILESAAGVVRATDAIDKHTNECPGCPACVLGPRGTR